MWIAKVTLEEGERKNDAAEKDNKKEESESGKGIPVSLARISWMESYYLVMSSS